MFSPKEKQEMLKDARSAKRRDAFRQARLAQPLPSLDAYLEFLVEAQKIFPQKPFVAPPAKGCFKL